MAAHLVYGRHKKARRQRKAEAGYLVQCRQSASHGEHDAGGFRRHHKALQPDPNAGAVLIVGHSTPGLYGAQSLHP